MQVVKYRRINAYAWWANEQLPKWTLIGFMYAPYQGDWIKDYTPLEAYEEELRKVYNTGIQCFWDSYETEIQRVE